MNPGTHPDPGSGQVTNILTTRLVNPSQVVIGKSGRFIKEDKAMDYVKGYCVALDMTARDLQVIFSAATTSKIHFWC